MDHTWLRQQFLDALRDAGANPDVRVEGDRTRGDMLFDGLVDRYAEPHRHYHALAHIERCLRTFIALRGTLVRLCATPEDPLLAWFRLALFWHDSVYLIGQYGSERASAEQLRRSLPNAFFGPQEAWAAAERGREHAAMFILLSDYLHDQEAPWDAEDVRVMSWFRDIDCAILGAPEAEFDAYEREIRLEYRAAEAALYVDRRTGILEDFLRDGVFHTDVFRWKYGAQAEANLRRSIHRLRAEGADAYLTQGD